MIFCQEYPLNFMWKGHFYFFPDYWYVVKMHSFQDHWLKVMINTPWGSLFAVHYFQDYCYMNIVGSFQDHTSCEY